MTKLTKHKTLVQRMWAAYCDAVGGTSHNGAPVLLQLLQGARQRNRRVNQPVFGKLGAIRQYALLQRRLLQPFRNIRCARRFVLRRQITVHPNIVCGALQSVRIVVGQYLATQRVAVSQHNKRSLRDGGRH